jgi:predicted PhzF superfamily epimerase YddE/YHI9
MKMPFFHVDAFTTEPGSGNASGVYLLPDSPLGGGATSESDYLQLLAVETNLPETGFLRARADGWALRWFTPKVELELCRHGTLAAAHILWERGLLDPSALARLHTRSGALTVRLLEEGWIEMEFPAFAYAPATLPGSVTATFTHPPREIYFAHDRHLVVLGSEAEVRGYRPDFERLKDHRMIITASTPDAPYDFVSRYFGVPLGVNEDPVTGSAHCALAPY